MAETRLNALRARVDYLRDLGIFDLYRRELRSVASAHAVSDDAGVPGEPLPQAAAATAFLPLPAHVRVDRIPDEELEDPAIAARKTPPQPIVFTPGPLIAPAARGKVLEAIRQEIGDCIRCPLGLAGRHSIVFGAGDANARLFFVGEGPGADEDAQGVPFVGRAGQLLNNMIVAMGLAREQVYIANIVKCRPPANRVPEPVEAHTCTQFLFRQIDTIRPQVIVALGSTAATYLLGGKSPLSTLRGRTHTSEIAPYARLIVTYHPAYLLRDPRQKAEAWGDLQRAMRELSGKR